MGQQTIVDIFHQQSLVRPDAIALGDSRHTRLTFATWFSDAYRVAVSLQRAGVARGDRVGLVFGNHAFLEFAVAYMGTIMCGAVAVTVNSGAASKWIRNALHSVDVRGAIVDDCGLAPALACPVFETADQGCSVAREADLPRLRAHDPAHIVFTSGSTGIPRPVLVSHDNLSWTFAEYGHREPSLHGSSVGSVVALNLLVRALTEGHTLVTADRLAPAAVADLVREYGVRELVLFPHMARLLVAGGDKVRGALRTVTRIMVGSGPSPPDLLDRLHHLMPRAQIMNVFSTTEAGPAFLIGYFDPTRPNAFGRPHPTLFRIVDEQGAPCGPGTHGELCLRTVRRPRTYVADAGLDANREWTRTGDVAYVDDQGYLYLLGRRDNAVTVGARTIFAETIERALLARGDVADTAVVPLPHPIFGETIGVVVAGAKSSLNEADLRRTIGAATGAPVPVSIAVVRSIPRAGGGKAARSALVELFAGVRVVRAKAAP